VNRTRQRAFATSLFLFVLVAGGHAATINLVGGTAGTIPGGQINEFIVNGLFPGPNIGGYYGAEVQFEASADATITFDYFGAEGDFVNSFLYLASVLFTHPGGMILAPNLATPLDSASFAQAPGTGLIPFSFTVNSGAGGFANGSNPDDSTGTAAAPNFFASCDPSGMSAGSGGTSCASLYVFLDDGGGGNDDNHDDMLVRISISEIPEPGTWILFGAGLILLGGLRRRQRC